MKLALLCVTLPGIEDVMAEEIEELLGLTPEFVVPGKLRLEATAQETLELVYSLRSANRVLLLVGEGTVDPMDIKSVYEIARRVQWDSYFSPDQTFAVRAERVGSHSYRSPDVAAEVGAAVVDHFLSTSGKRIRANLDEPDVIVRVYVSGRSMLVGIDLVGESLHKRGYRRYQHPASLSPVAYALVRLTGWLDGLRRDDSTPLVDPMCGGGTIPIEAALAAKQIPPGKWRRRRGWPLQKLALFSEEDLEDVLDRVDSRSRREFSPVIYASDISPKHVAGAALNALSAGVSDSIAFSVFSAADLPSRVGRIGALATNPPYELRTGRRRDIEAAFRGIAQALLLRLELRAAAILGGPALPKFERAMESLNLVERRRVKYGGVDASILVYERGRLTSVEVHS